MINKRRENIKIYTHIAVYKMTHASKHAGNYAGKHDLLTTHNTWSLIGIQCNKPLQHRADPYGTQSRGFRPCLSRSSGMYLLMPCFISSGVYIYNPIIEARSTHGLRLIAHWYKQTLCHMECTHVVQWIACKHCHRILVWAASNTCLHIRGLHVCSLVKTSIENEPRHTASLTVTFPHIIV
jgi:hypothetical protein